jgi:hypothetical protein
MDDQLDQAALDYHRFPQPEKISVMPTEAMTNQRDLSLACSPGVAAACMAIAGDAKLASDHTSRGNLVADEGITVGPILPGATRPAHILTPASTVRRIVNMTALSVLKAETVQ